MKTRPEILALAPAVLTVALFVVRVWRTGEETYVFLPYNVALAAIPVVLALVADWLDRVGEGGWSLATLGGWLLFLPNAPYVLTDFVHLRHRPPVPMWFDVALLGAASLAGFALGAASLARVHAIVRRRYSPKVAHGAIAAASFLSGYGIYLGRFTRLNSWDLALDPLAVLARALPPVLDPLHHVQAWGVTCVFGALTAAAFLAQSSLAPAEASSRAS